MRRIPIVIIGGGTGTSVLLEGLARYPVDPTVIVSTADSGGSSGVLRRELGIPPVGDIRQCLLPLSSLSSEEKQLWNHRFTKGHLKGHSIGNLLLAALWDMTGNMEEALAYAQRLWKLRGTILPMTERPTTLCVRYGDGTVVCDEHAIDEPKHLHGVVARAYLKSREQVYGKAVRAIARTHAIIFAPGDLFTSTVPFLLTRGVKDALRKSRVPIVYVANLMTSRGETDSFTVGKLVATLDRYLHPRSADIVIVNTAPFPHSVCARYRKEHEYPIPFDRNSSALLGKRIVARPLLHRGAVHRTKGDLLRRSLLRHDPAKLAHCIMEILMPSPFRRGKG